MSSRRQYLTQTELAEYADITIVDSDEADDQISQAEELIDSYVGFQGKFMQSELVGVCATQTSLSLTLQPTHQNTYEKDYFVGCQVEIIGGTGKGQQRTVTASTKAGVLTIGAVWSSTPDSTSYYCIRQLGKFPRQCDVKYFSETGEPTFFKVVPEAVKRATAAQVQFQIEMGENYFSTDQSEKQSESIGDYSYSNVSGGVSGAAGISKLIAPKARTLLRGIKNRVGQIQY